MKHEVVVSNTFLNFHPDPWGFMIQFDLCIFLTNGWFNHQLDTWTRMRISSFKTLMLYFWSLFNLRVWRSVGKTKLWNPQKVFRSWGIFQVVMVNKLHPGKFTWNLKITCLKRNIIFQTFIFGFHVDFQGCYITCLKRGGGKNHHQCI